MSVVFLVFVQPFWGLCARKLWTMEPQEREPEVPTSPSTTTTDTDSTG